MTSSYLPLVLLAQKVAKFAFFASSCLGLILIFLTLFGVRKIFGTYKYVMVVFTSLGICLAAMEVTFHPNLHFYNSGWVFFTLTLPFYSNKKTMENALAVYAGVYSMTISLIAVQFIYRYWTLFNIHYLTYFRGWKSVIWVFYCLFFAGSWCFGAAFLLKMDEVSEDYFKKEMLLRYNALTTDIPMLTFLAYDPLHSCLRYRNFLYLVLISMVMGCQYTIMWYCGWKMHIKMEEKLENFSRALKCHHRQLFKTLVLQITAPSIFLFSPLIPIMFLPFFQLELDFPAGAAFSAFSFYPALDSIIVLLVVSEYKQVVKRLVKSTLLSSTPREGVYNRRSSIQIVN